ncbi:DUF481 domain-containing protein [Thalassorhabdomicrobium marinisediminis]|uniref:DUF481 domain-containing protein n=1 Tax=Thalassorhabdomicrobium marinisediminis TaxID=2170577 RepID=A0A2T7FXV2_9RHOB|nr:DUF481 domain-containing protein [Thalassorhabdomicrobium marinisediminis]PVA06996.1 DUF481 domain-containing protein [Thalassorhabdomicrobium marinisediminis]
MTKTYLLMTAAVVAFAGAPAMAQTVLGDSAAETRNEDLRESIEDDFERDVPSFGNEGRALGFDGSVALQANATDGNTDNASVGLGMNMGYYDGLNGYDLQLSYQYAETDGVSTEESLLYSAQYTRDFGRSYFGFAKLQGSVDSLPFDTSDNYLGAGVGYRIYNTADLQWSVQGGVGYRVADLNTADDLEEPAISVSSNYYNSLTDTVSLTNDTDIIASDSDTVVYNDLGVNVAMTDVLALRTSVQTEYHTDPQPGLKDTDNTFGVSLVYNFQ